MLKADTLLEDPFAARPSTSSTEATFPREIEDRLLKAFRQAASEVPAYRALLAEQGISAYEVVDAAAFSRLCPVLSKRNTFDRFAIDQLCGAGNLRDLAEVLTSSGHGGRFSFGLISRKHAEISAHFIDKAFDAAFQVDTRSTLAINCLPMGVGFSSHRMTVATTSVREDMAVALVHAFGKHFEQILLVGDPLFLTKLVDYAAGQAVAWSQYRVNVAIGEEIFGEHFRGYLAGRLGLDTERPENGYIMSSFGVGELGLHLCHETPATIALRRAAFVDAEFARELFGTGQGESALPMIFTFNALRTFIEVVDRDSAGFGYMTISMLDPELPMPLLRYQTGDIVRLLNVSEVATIAHRHGVPLPADLPPTLLALRGRHNEKLPNGSHIGLYKDAVYANHVIARELTGAFRLLFVEQSCTMHVQLKASAASHESFVHAVLHALPGPVRPAQVVFWPYARFPFGMSLDYERKFSYYAPGETLALEA